MSSKLQLLPHDIKARLERVPRATCIVGLDTLWLFGSFARGEATPISDVDFAYLPASSLTGETRDRFDTELYSTIARTLGTDEFTLVDLSRAPAFFAWKVLQEGQVLSRANTLTAVKFVEDTLQRAADEQVLRSSGNRQFLEALEMAEPQIDRERVAELLRLVSDDLRALQEKAQATADAYCGSRDLQAIVERRLQTAIEGCINIGNHIIARLQFRVPSDYADVFRILGESHVLPWNAAEQMMDMARFRNLLVHVYWAIDHARVHASLNARLATLEVFTRHVATLLKKQVSCE